MSLINDALRRASQAERDRPREISTPPSMPPTEPPPRRSFLLIILMVPLIVALLLASWIFWPRANAPVTAPPEIVVAAPKVEPVSQPAPAPVPAPAPPKVIVPAAPVPLPVVVPEAWPNLKLQGIFFSAATPRVLINGRALAVGDEIDGARVTKIENDQVTLEWKGRGKVLIMAAH